ncbi:MAG: radical SAM protein [Planctomycetota bacterium]|jgi:putative pyruvate formate lyase activating enzyme
MYLKSRRSFIKSCLFSALAAVTHFLPSGCKRKTDSASNDNISGGNSKKDKGTTVANIDPDFEPGYLKLHKTGELAERGQKLWNIMESCKLCPRMCGVNKLKGEKGFCQANSQLEISDYHPHYGEEKPLVGNRGSGAIFLTNCGLRCVFCINWQISQGGEGSARTVEDFANMMLSLQLNGCHNINVVTPTHYSPHIVLALDIAASEGLRVPLVYNTCGWEREEILKILDGIVDIYLPDFKYSDGEMAAKYSSGSSTYPEITQKALLEMHHQVGLAKPHKDGLMYRGLMIRHLVMPNRISGSKKVIQWIAENLPKETYVNIMSQYTPVYKASEYPKISRKITRNEFTEVITWAKEAGLTNLDIQSDRFLIDG